MDKSTVETNLTFYKLLPSTVMWLFSIITESSLKEGEQEEQKMGGLPGEGCPEEARLGGEAVKRSHQMCWHVMITPGFSRVRGLTGRLSLWLTSAGLFIISNSQACDEPSTILMLIWACTPCGKSLNCSHRKTCCFWQHVCWVTALWLHPWYGNVWKDLIVPFSIVGNQMEWGQ